MLETIDQQTIAIERAEPLGAYDLIEISGSSPGTDLIEQRLGRGWIVLTFEQIKLRLMRAVMRIEAPILQRGDAANITPGARGDEEVGVGVFVERMLVFVEQHFHIDAQRRHPLGMLFI